MLALIVAAVVLVDRGWFALFTTRLDEVRLLVSEKAPLLHRIINSGKHYDVAAVGSSLVQFGFDPQAFERVTGLKSFNAGIANNSQVDRSYRVIRDIVEKKGAALIIYVVDSWSFNVEPSSGPYDQRPRDQIVDLFYAFENRDNFFAWMKTLASGHIEPFPVNVPDPTARRYRDFTGATLHPDGFLEAHAVAREDYIAPLGNAVFNPEQVASLDEIIALLRGAGVKLVMVQMPEHLVALEAFPKRHTDFAGFMQRLVERTGVTYLDFSRDEAFPFRDVRYFLDTNHLNATGAALFTELLAQRMKTANLLLP